MWKQNKTIQRGFYFLIVTSLIELVYKNYNLHLYLCKVLLIESAAPSLKLYESYERVCPVNLKGKGQIWVIRTRSYLVFFLVYANIVWTIP